MTPPIKQTTSVSKSKLVSKSDRGVVGLVNTDGAINDTPTDHSVVQSVGLAALAGWPSGSDAVTPEDSIPRDLST